MRAGSPSGRATRSAMQYTTRRSRTPQGPGLLRRKMLALESDSVWATLATRSRRQPRMHRRPAIRETWTPGSALGTQAACSPRLPQSSRSTTRCCMLKKLHLQLIRRMDGWRTPRQHSPQRRSGSRQPAEVRRPHRAQSQPARPVRLRRPRLSLKLGSSNQTPPRSRHQSMREAKRRRVHRPTRLRSSCKSWA